MAYVRSRSGATEPPRVPARAWPERRPPRDRRGVRRIRALLPYLFACAPRDHHSSGDRAYSRQWYDATIDPERRLLLAAIESEVLAQQCLVHNLVYEAIQFHLARLRLLCELRTPTGRRRYPSSGTARGTASRHLRRLHQSGTGGVGRETGPPEHLVGDLHMNTYPVQCAHIIEIASLAYFTAPDDEHRDQYAAFVAEFVQAEPGCAHPISDRSAASLVLATLLLLDGQRADASTPTSGPGPGSATTTNNAPRLGGHRSRREARNGHTPRAGLRIHRYLSATQ